MGKLFSIELKKLRKSTAMRVMLIVAAALSVLNVIVYGALDAMAGELADMIGTTNGYSIALQLSRDSSDIMLIVVILMAVLVGGDFSARTLQTQVAAGYGRFQIIVSRFLSSALAYVILYAIYFGVTIAGVSLVLGFGENITGDMMGDLFLNLFLNFLIAMTMLAIYMFFAFLLKSTGATIGVSLPLMLMGTSILQIIVYISETVENVLSFTPFGQQIQLIEGGSVYGADIDVVRFVCVCVVWFVAFIACTYMSFRNAELK